MTAIADRAKKINRVLIANRGEIAMRVIRAAKDLGIETVAVYADSDRRASFVALADEALPLGGDSPAGSYLNGEKLIEAALRSGADSLHPGYGFLSEDANFAQAVEEAGLVWIGPPGSAIRLLGDKVSAREIARSVGATPVPGSEGTVSDVEQIRSFVAEHGPPIVIKAAFGGGGRGMRVVNSSSDVEPQFESARREALFAFGRGECYVERFIEGPRHIEVQILADNYGSIEVLGTRDCTLQRRHQKIVEEAPAPFLPSAQSAIFASWAKDICRAVGYVGAGTVEYLLERDGSVWFLEVNTRLQVEHPVTEETGGIDIVCEQFRIAAGGAVSDRDILTRGHSMEFRINAEDPANGFAPSLGTISTLRFPLGPGVRVDAGVESGGVIGGQFDSLIAKLIVTGADRNEALRRARRALDEFSIEGVATSLSLLRAIVRARAFSTDVESEFLVHTGWLESDLLKLNIGSAAGALDVTIEIGGRALVVLLPIGLDPAVLARRDNLGSPDELDSDSERVLAPMQGTVVRVVVTEGQLVAEGDPLFVVEAMKMENAVFAQRAGTVADINAIQGQSVRQGRLLCRIAHV